MGGFRCRTCGKEHPGPPLVLGADAPAFYADAAPEERARALLNADQSVIAVGGEAHFCLRGRLEIPVIDGDRPFAWLVWVSVDEETFERACELWEQPGREKEPPHDGRLCSRLPYTESTMDLRTQIHTRPVGERPFIELQPTEHRLGREQREGISMARVRELAERALHP